MIVAEEIYLKRSTAKVAGDVSAGKPRTSLRHARNRTEAVKSHEST